MLVVKSGEAVPKEDIIKTPSFGLNYILGGGLWSGRMHILWGDATAGKTTMALYAAAEAQSRGYYVHIIDSEGSINDSWSETCGLDLDNRTVIRSGSMEEILEYMRKVLRDGQKNFWIIDSINAIIPEDEYAEKKDGAKQAQALGARSQKLFIQRLNHYLIQDVNNIMVMIAQKSMQAAGMYWVPKANMGNYTRHMASNIIRLTPSNSEKDNKVDEDGKVLVRKVTWTVEKSKQGPIAGTKGCYFFSPVNAHIDKEEEILDIAIRNNLIHKGGAWYTWGDDKVQGLIKLKELVEMNNGWESLEDQLMNMQLKFDDESGATFETGNAFETA
jgi:recombination protein RecA